MPLGLRNAVVLLAVCACLAGCMMQPVAHDNLNATLWFQTAAEYEGNSLTVYAAATDRLQYVVSEAITADIEQAEKYDCRVGIRCDALASLPPAVVLDVDETVLDNGPYQARLVKNDTGYDPVTWDAWIAERAARAIPGAVAFIRAAKASGMAVIYITNRSCAGRPGLAPSCPQREDTLENLGSAGFPPMGNRDLLILRNERPEWNQSEKKLRRAHIADQYRIAMLIGDDLGDLGSDIKRRSLADRRDFVHQYESLFGRLWFQLSNPLYGSWDRAVPGPKRDSLDTTGE